MTRDIHQLGLSLSNAKTMDLWTDALAMVPTMNASKDPASAARAEDGAAAVKAPDLTDAAACGGSSFRTCGAAAAPRTAEQESEQEAERSPWPAAAAAAAAACYSSWASCQIDAGRGALEFLAAFVVEKVAGSKPSRYCTRPTVTASASRIHRTSSGNDSSYPVRTNPFN